MQLMPRQRSVLVVTIRDDPVENIEAGTKYLSWLLKRFEGNVELALAGYNAGEGSVDKYDGIPPYNETRNYVKIISQRYGKTLSSSVASRTSGGSISAPRRLKNVGPVEHTGPISFSSLTAFLTFG